MGTSETNTGKNSPGGNPPLRRGWTTGACATAATKAALLALLDGDFPDPVTITLPKGQTPSFALAIEQKHNDWAMAGIIKDAGDDPDITHLATIEARVEHGENDQGIKFKAGNGVGTVTKPGLPIAPGNPAINPVPRTMMIEVVREICESRKIAPDFTITISIPDGEELAARTWNPRLGIIGGLSILGTTGIVNPFSCSAWIHSIHRGIDVCRATGIEHVLGATGSTSEKFACTRYNFPPEAMLDMGDFAGGLLKYLRQNPIPILTLAGGFAKFAKLAQGAMDLHSGRSQVDMNWLAEQAAAIGAGTDLIDQISQANTALEVSQLAASADLDLPTRIAQLAREKALEILRGAPISVEVLIVSRDGKLLAQYG